MTFTHNTVYRCAGDMINHQQHGTVSDNVFTDNTFDGTVSYIGTPATSPDMIYFANVSGATFSDNVVKTDFGSLLIGLVDSSNNTFEGNQVTDIRAQADAHQCVWAMTDSSANTFDNDCFESHVKYGTVVFRSGSDQNTIDNSTFVSYGQSPSAHDSGLTLNLINSTYR
jgi:hypothetical protein